MKLEEMADVLDGLAGTLEKFLGKTAVSDFRTVSECFRKFPGENVANFCNYVIQVREGKSSQKKTGSGANGAKIEEYVAKVQDFLDHRDRYDYPALRSIGAQIGKLTIAEIKAIGERIGCPLTEKTKAKMAASLENWLTNIKMSAEQMSFTLSGAGRG